MNHAERVARASRLVIAELTLSSEIEDSAMNGEKAAFRSIELTLKRESNVAA